LTAERAHAAPGESLESVESGRKALSAASGPTAFSSTDPVREIVPDATTVREYDSLADIVVGLAVNGLVYWALTHVSGSNADGYQSALSQVPSQQEAGLIQVKINLVVVETWGMHWAVPKRLIRSRKE
jgi:hypothetical protein